MTLVFADTQYFVALINPNDQGYCQARVALRSLGAVTLFTTEEVLIEVLTFFAERGRHSRQLAATAIDRVLAGPGFIILEQSHESFLDGFAFYKARPDKGYSLTDAISMTVMNRLGITAILTHDHHFAQEGFRTLL